MRVFYFLKGLLQALNPIRVFNQIFELVRKLNPIKIIEQSLRIVVLLLVAFILYSHQAEINHIKSETGIIREIPFDAFAQVEVGVLINSPPDGGQSFEFTSVGSGMLIDYKDGISTILTADHVCNPPPLDHWYGLVGRQNIEKTVSITSYYGNIVEAEVVLNDTEYDLCLVRAEVYWTIPVNISSVPPRVGEKIYNVASPTGFFYPGMVPILEGRYSGDLGYPQDYDSVYSVYTRRGSSGSAVLNSHGEIIGIIHSAIGDLSHVGIASTWQELNDFMLTYEVFFY